MLEIVLEYSLLSPVREEQLSVFNWKLFTAGIGVYEIAQ